jgi:NADP-dependent 3-hydroxy acid dehydrogenase YdfG
MGKLTGKVAVITAATSGMALATAKLFVEEGAYAFITGRRQDKLDDAVRAIGRNVTGVQGDAANLSDLDRLYETVKKEKGYIDVLFASAGQPLVEEPVIIELVYVTNKVGRCIAVGKTAARGCPFN